MEYIPTIVQIGDKEFEVCKSILISSSAVFKEMFAQVDIRDQREIRIEIFGLDADVFEAMHEYLLQGRMVEQIYAVADRLVIAADKYQIDSLKNECEQYLLTKIDSTNVCDYLLIGQTANAANLKSACMKYIKSNLNSVMQTPQWAQLISGDNNTELVAELGQMMTNPTGIAYVELNIFQQFWRYQCLDWLKILGFGTLGLFGVGVLLAVLAAILFAVAYIIVIFFVLGLICLLIIIIL